MRLATRTPSTIAFPIVQRAQAMETILSSISRQLTMRNFMRCSPDCCINSYVWRSERSLVQGAIYYVVPAQGSVLYRFSCYWSQPVMLVSGGVESGSGCLSAERSERIDYNAKNGEWSGIPLCVERGKERSFMVRRSVSCPRRRSGLFNECKKVFYDSCQRAWEFER